MEEAKVRGGSKSWRATELAKLEKLASSKSRARGRQMDEEGRFPFSIFRLVSEREMGHLALFAPASLWPLLRAGKKCRGRRPLAARRLPLRGFAVSAALAACTVQCSNGTDALESVADRARG